MTAPKHSHATFHKGMVPPGQIASGTPAEGDVPTVQSDLTLAYEPGGGAHPDLATHDALGLATDTELAAHAAGADVHHAEDHATRHDAGGDDAMTIDAAAATGSLRTLGAGAAQAAAGDHAHAASGIGEILIADAPSTPLIFADLIQNEATDDLVYGDP